MTRYCSGLIVLALLALVPTMVGCAGTPPHELYDPYVDIGVALTGKTEGGIINNAGRTVISDVATDLQIQDFALIVGAELADDGSIKRGGDAEVLLLEFVSRGELSVLSFDERVVVLALEVASDGTITKGFFGGKRTGVGALMRDIPEDSFQSGKLWFLYRDKAFAVGQLNAKFFGHHFSGNFRVIQRAR